MGTLEELQKYLFKAVCTCAFICAIITFLSPLYSKHLNNTSLLRRYKDVYSIYIDFFTIVEHHYTVIIEESPLDTSDSQNTEMYTLPTLSRHSAGSFIEIGT